MPERCARIFLTLILAIAGVGHFLRPDLLMPAMPPDWPLPYFTILATGAIELAAAAGLWVGPRVRRFTGWMLVLYFLALLPVHVHVAWNRVPMFGIDQPFWLWARIPFQAVFIWPAWILARSGR